MFATSLLPREYIELQLRFAGWISHGDAGSFPLAVLAATNLFRRFKLGHPDDASTSSEWQRYVAELCNCASLGKLLLTTRRCNACAVARGRTTLRGTSRCSRPNTSQRCGCGTMSSGSKGRRARDSSSITESPIAVFADYYCAQPVDN
jgi:hypothetical protein